MEETTISAIVPAAGCGARAALNGNKVLAPLGGRPLLAWTLGALFGTPNLVEFVLAARDEDRESIHELILDDARRRFVHSRRAGAPLVRMRLESEEDDTANWRSSDFPLRIVAGGATRLESVLNAVRCARGKFVLVHDAARPCVSAHLVRAVCARAIETGGAIAALPVSDTVKLADETGTVAQTLDRNRVWLAQTPQVFAREPFLEALEKAQREGFEATDCASVMERAGHHVALVEGEPSNLKVTFAADVERAEAILGANSTL